MGVDNFTGFTAREADSTCQPNSSFEHAFVLTYFSVTCINYRACLVHGVDFCSKASVPIIGSHTVFGPIAIFYEHVVSNGS